MMLGRLFDPKDRGLVLTVVSDPSGRPVAVCQFVPSPAIKGYSLDLMRRDPGEHPNGLLDYALCSTIEHFRQRGARGLSLNFAAFRSVLDGERGEGTFTRVERWAIKRLSGILPIESLWTLQREVPPDVVAAVSGLSRRRKLRTRRRGHASRREHLRDPAARTAPRARPLEPSLHRRARRGAGGRAKVRGTHRRLKRALPTQFLYRSAVYTNVYEPILLDNGSHRPYVVNHVCFGRARAGRAGQCRQTAHRLGSGHAIGSRIGDWNSESSWAIGKSRDRDCDSCG